MDDFETLQAMLRGASEDRVAVCCPEFVTGCVDGAERVVGPSAGALAVLPTYCRSIRVIEIEGHAVAAQAVAKTLAGKAGRDPPRWIGAGPRSGQTSIVVLIGEPEHGAIGLWRATAVGSIFVGTPIRAVGVRLVRGVFAETVMGTVVIDVAGRTIVFSVAGAGAIVVEALIDIVTISAAAALGLGAPLAIGDPRSIGLAPQRFVTGRVRRA